MSKFFSYYPIIQYQNVFVRDISRRSKFVDKYLSDVQIFLPYTIEEGDRPEDIAQLYYGTTDATWLVLLANNIIDPYFDWPMPENTFNNFIIEKYKNISKKEGHSVLDWAKDETINDNILYYYYELDDSPINSYDIHTIPSDVVSHIQANLPENFDKKKFVINGVEYFVTTEDTPIDEITPDNLDNYLVTESNYILTTEDDEEFVV